MMSDDSDATAPKKKGGFKKMLMMSVALVALVGGGVGAGLYAARSEEHTSELQSLMRISYAVFCLKKKNKNNAVADRTTYNSTTQTKETTTYKKNIYDTKHV